MKTLIMVGLAMIAMAALPGCSTANRPSAGAPTFSNLTTVQSLVPFPDMRIGATQSGLPLPAGQ